VNNPQDRKNENWQDFEDSAKAKKKEKETFWLGSEKKGHLSADDPELKDDAERLSKIIKESDKHEKTDWPGKRRLKKHSRSKRNSGR